MIITTNPVEFLIIESYGGPLNDEGSINYWNKHKCPEESHCGHLSIQILQRVAVDRSETSQTIRCSAATVRM